MKHLLDTRELTREEAIEILDVADYMAQVKAENRTLKPSRTSLLLAPPYLRASRSRTRRRLSRRLPRMLS